MSKLDQIVKGPPPPEANLPYAVANTPSPPVSSSSYYQGSETLASVAPDPLSTLPSSPPQIYLNLLILESALRSQYLALRARKRQNIFFLLLLTLWIAYFSYALFLRPREDGRGLGGSVYWVVETGEKVALMGGVVTGILIWGTGQWEHGLRWPRRWLGVANRGLRGMNAKIVVMRGPWWKEILSYLSFIFPYSAFFPSNISFRYVEREKPNGERHYRQRTHGHTSGRHSLDEDSDAGVEEDLAPGGDYIRLLLLPKSFSPAFRENWDEYRSEYWDKENERRARLRRQVKQRDREQAKIKADQLWWARWWKSEKIFPFASKNGRDKEKPHNETHQHHHYRHHKPAHSRNIGEKDPLMRSRRTGSSVSESFTHSRTSSRSTTPNPFSDGEDKMTGSDRDRDRDRDRERGGSRNVGNVAAEPGRERGRRNRSSLSPGSTAGSRVPSPLTQIEGQRDEASSPQSNNSIKSHE